MEQPASASFERQQDEVAALAAIYPQGVGVELSAAQGRVVIVVGRASLTVTATFQLPADYPESESPSVSLAVGGAVDFDDARVLKQLPAELELLLEREFGSEVLYPAIEIIRQRVEELQSATTPTQQPSEAHPQLIPVPVIATTTLEIFHSQPLIEKKSTFIAHCARVTSMAEVQEFRAFLLSDKKIARATHNIFAFRFSSPEGLQFHDNDDDGESAAGGRLAELVRLMSLPCGVAVIVSRWFGGILLGPSRFTLINNCARVLLEEKFGASTRG
jgi:hypothetical protein